MAQDDKTRANALIDENSDAGGLNIEALADALSKTVMTWTFTVFEVFNIFTERQFTQAAHEQLAVSLINRINGANLIQLAQSEHGKILLERIAYIMNCQANANQLTCQNISLAVKRAKETADAKYCGVNPVTGTPGIRDDSFVPGQLRAGGFGNIRPGNGGPGGFHDRNGRHSGVDIVAPVGTPIVASMNGMVIKVVNKYGLANTEAARRAQNGGYGNAVTIKYNNGLYGYYAHLTSVSAGEQTDVKQGDVIGTSGRTGNANNPYQPSQDNHLHYGRFKKPFNEDRGFPLPDHKSSWIDPVKSLNNPCK